MCVRHRVAWFAPQFAASPNLLDTWEEELEGGCCPLFSDSDFDHDESVCNKFTAFFCGRLLGADRVGNMPVLLSSRSCDANQGCCWSLQKRFPALGMFRTRKKYEFDADHDTDGDASPLRAANGPTRIYCVMGPFWPCMVCVTYPLVGAVSMFAFFVTVQDGPVWVKVLWTCSTLILVLALACTGCRDPGIVRRRREQPVHASGWRWSDQTETFRPPGAVYDRDCGVVIEEFDHTCPWTGTGIGRKNMPCFSVFVAMICFCLIFNILLIVGVFGPMGLGNDDDDK